MSSEQYKKILSLLIDGKVLTASGYAKLTGCVKLSTRIGELIRFGFPITKQDGTRNGDVIKFYSIKPSSRIASEKLYVKLFK